MPNKMLPRSPRLRPLVAARRASLAAPDCPTRVRRLTCPEIVVAAYGPAAVASMPWEIVDYAGGARTCEWSDHRRTRTYASEADMWRDLHARAGHAARQRDASVISYDGDEIVIVELFSSRSERSAREAWSVRPAALAAMLGGGYAPLARRPDWIAVPGEDDGRALDTLGRRNGRGGRPTSGAGTLRA